MCNSFITSSRKDSNFISFFKPPRVNRHFQVLCFTRATWHCTRPPREKKTSITYIQRHTCRIYKDFFFLFPFLKIEKRSVSIMENVVCCRIPAVMCYTGGSCWCVWHRPIVWTVALFHTGKKKPNEKSRLMVCKKLFFFFFFFAAIESCQQPMLFFLSYYISPLLYSLFIRFKWLYTQIDTCIQGRTSIQSEPPASVFLLFIL